MTCYRWCLAHLRLLSSKIACAKLTFYAQNDDYPDF